MADNDDDELYDEFGNYIGPELDSSSSDDDDDDDDDSDNDNDEPPQPQPDDASDVSGDRMIVIKPNDDGDTTNAITVAPVMNAIVLHEDKEHYPSASETFGEGVRSAVLDEDAMDLDTPIVEPIVTKSKHVDTIEGSNEYAFQYSDEYLSQILSNDTTRTRRGVALVGHLHHGKTSFVDCLLEPTLRTGFGPRAALEEQVPKFTDTLKSEQERQMSLVSTPITLLLPDTRGKTYGMTLVDCPGHTQFHDESVAALRVVDGAILLVDAVEGIMMHTELLIQQIVAEGLPLLLIINKLDRLIVELKLPPRDAYYKLLQLVESVNQKVQQASCGRYPSLSPTHGNVAFGSALHGYYFTLASMSKVYAEQQDDDDDEGENNNNASRATLEQFSNRLWGDWYWDPESQTFEDAPTPNQKNRSFVTFCLEPLYKIYAACLGEQEQHVQKVLRSLGVLLKRDQLRSSARPLLRAALSKFMETATCGIVDMMVQHV
jgi:U5 small nuclear ribonucleoprotein component